ncbi:MAG: hypothetical protein ACHQ49_03565 [Elusimicrobiota bacterium]
MDFRSRRRVVFALLLAAGGCLSRVKNSPRGDVAGDAVQRRSLAEATLAQWGDYSASAGHLLMAEYGVPDEVHYERLVWNNNAPWRRTVVRDVRPSYVEGDELGVIEQTIDAALTPAQAQAVAAYDGRVRYDPRAAELTSRSDREAVNILRLNVAGDVATERMTGEQARAYGAKVLDLEASGRTEPDLLTLRFGLRAKP